MHDIKAHVRLIIAIICGVLVWGGFTIFGDGASFFPAFIGGFLFQVVDYSIYNHNHNWKQGKEEYVFYMRYVDKIPEKWNLVKEKWNKTPRL